jgi:hypothetical protein
MKTNKKLASTLLVSDNAEVTLFWRLHRLLRLLKCCLLMSLLSLAILAMGMYVKTHSLKAELLQKTAEFMMPIGGIGIIIFLVVAGICWLSTADRKFASSQCKRRKLRDWEKRFLKEFPWYGRQALRSAHLSTATGLAEAEMIEWLLIIGQSPSQEGGVMLRVRRMRAVALERFKVRKEGELIEGAQKKYSDSTRAHRG